MNECPQQTAMDDGVARCGTLHHQGQSQASPAMMHCTNHTAAAAAACDYD